jgi:hypothetical protein
MAVTISQSPQAATPSDNPILWVFSSDQTAQANFKYRVTVYINSNVHSAHDIVPEFGIYAKFDASEIASALCSSAVLIAPYATIDAGNYLYVHIVVTEYYGTPATPQASATATQVLAFKARLSNNGFVQYNLNNYQQQSGLGRWLTQCPEHMVGDDDIMWLTCLTGGGNKSLRTTLYDVGGNVVATNTTSTDSYSAIPLAQFQVDPNALMTRHGFTSGDIAQTHYYTVDFGTGSNWVRETIYIDRTCTDAADVMRVYFLAHLGSLELFRFTKLRRDNMSIERNEYQAPFGNWSGTSFNFNMIDGEKKGYLSSYATQVSLASDWISEALQNWLAYNLLPSPIQLIRQGATAIIFRVKCTDGGTQIHNEKSDNPLHQQVVNFDKSETAHTQLL